MSKYSQAPFSRNNISYCLHWKVVISSQWVNSSRKPSLCASNSRLPNGIQNELLRRGLNNRHQSASEDAKKQRCFPVWAHARIHTHSGIHRSSLRILAWKDPQATWVPGLEETDLSYLYLLVWDLLNHLISVPKEYLSASFDPSQEIKTFRLSLCQKLIHPQGFYKTFKNLLTEYKIW